MDPKEFSETLLKNLLENREKEKKFRSNYFTAIAKEKFELDLKNINWNEILKIEILMFLLIHFLKHLTTFLINMHP